MDLTLALYADLRGTEILSDEALYARNIDINFART